MQDRDSNWQQLTGVAYMLLLRCAVQTQRDLMAVLSADNHDMDLKRMGVLTGLAVGLHNLVSCGCCRSAALRLYYHSHGWITRARMFGLVSCLNSSSRPHGLACAVDVGFLCSVPVVCTLPPLCS